MTVDLGSAVIRVEADTSNLSRGIDGAKLLMLGLGAAAAAAAGHALELAGNFEQQNTMLVTSAGESVKNLQMISDGVLKVSTDTGQSTTDLEAAMYKIESAGLHGKSALDALKAAAEGAKLENSDLGTVADAETTIMVDYASKHVTATQAMNDLIATVARGKTNIQDLAASMASVLPTAAAVGASLTDTSAAMATMTAEGTPAANAATYLRQMLLALEVPGSKAVTVFKEVGLTSKEVSDEMKVSLPDTLQMIIDAIGKKFPEGSAAYVAALKDVAGGSKNFQAWLELTGTHLAVFKQNADQVTASVKNAGSSISGWADIQQNFNLQMDKAHASLDAFAIKMGTALMPDAQKLVVLFQQDLMPRLNDFSGWMTSTGLPALENFGGWFTGTAVPAVESFANTIERNLLPPVESLIGETIPLVEHFASWLQSSQALQLAIQDVSSTLGSLVTMVAGFEQGLQDGNPQVALLAGGITAVGTAIGLVKIAEFGASWYNWFQQMQAGAGFIANVSAKALPELNTALGWTKTSAQEAETQISAIAPVTLSASQQAQADIDELIASFGEVDAAAAETGTAIAAIGPEATATEGVVAGASTGMTLALGAATAGISLLIGAVVAAVIEGNGKISQSFKDTEAQLGTSADDNAAKAKATAIETSTVAGEQWHSAYAQQIKDSNNARAIAVLDQQKIADAAAAAAQKTEDSFNQMLLDLANQYGITVAQIQGLPPIPTVKGPSQGPGGHHPLPGGHASGGVIPPGQYGMVDDQPGAPNGELMYGGTSGISVLPANQTAALFGGGSQETHVHNHIYLDGREMTDMLMNRAVQKIRTVAGARR